jgi:hypothetical protein
MPSGDDIEAEGEAESDDCCCGPCLEAKKKKDKTVDCRQ